MSGRVLGLFASPLADARSLYRRGLRYKANPRSSAYMRTLFEERWPNGRFIDVADDRSWQTALVDAERIVLLYPDAIGIGFSRIERAVRRSHPGSIEVVNGRRRRFTLDPRVRRALGMRRLLAWTMGAEALVGAMILLVSPFLAAYDAARGRR